VPNITPSQLTLYLQAAFAMVKETMSSDGHGSRTLSTYTSTLSRGLGEAPLADAFIFPQANSTLDLSPIVGNNSKKIYQFALCHVGSGGTPECSGSPVPTPTKTTAEGRITWAPPTVLPGLYELFSCDLENGRAARADSAFIVIGASDRTTERMRKDYLGFASLMSGWDPYERSMLLRAYMTRLNLTENN
jgi:hypothetical protein